jgi:zinc transport system substrate-binding protein
MNFFRLGILLGILVGWGMGPAAWAGSERIPVFTSIFPVADMVREVGQERVRVQAILPPGASPHTFEPTPQQMVELSKARLFIKIGAGLEFWAEKLLRAGTSGGLAMLDLSQGMPLLREVHGHSHRPHEKREVPSPRESVPEKAEGADPHYWLDPLLAQKMVERIADRLGALDPAGQKIYLANASRFNRELETLHREILEKVRSFKVREYVTFHPAWNYFSNRYGLKVVGVIMEAPGREPSPRDIARMVKELKTFKTRIVFAEPQFHPKIVQAIAKEAQAQVLFLDPLGDPENPEKNGYLRLMRYNLTQMEKAMR